MTAGRPINSTSPVADAPPLSRYPWWLWPNLLAFDAPGVGVVWQRFLGSAFDISIPLSATISLFLIVWGVYLTDRWLDAAPRRPPEPGDRHRFARRHRVRFGRLAGIIWAVAIATTVFALPYRYVVAGAIVAALVASYFAVVHRTRIGRANAKGGKEAAVGILFAAGVGVPLMADAASEWPSWVPSVASFGLLCWLNCELITRWESSEPACSQWVANILVLTICGMVWICPVPVRWALLASLAGLLFIHLSQRRLGPRLARVLADAALLTPLIRYTM